MDNLYNKAFLSIKPFFNKAFLCHIGQFRNPCDVSFLCLIIYNMISHPARLISAMSLCLGDPALQPLKTATPRFVNLMMTRRMLMIMTMKRIDNGGDDDHDHV